MLFWKKKVENDTNISHINRQKDWKTNILMIFVRYNKQFCKGDKKIYWNVLTTISLSDIIYSQRAYSRRKKWIYFIHFLQKQMKFCCGREKKRAVFPPRAGCRREAFVWCFGTCFTCWKTDGSISVQAKTELFYQHYLLPALQKHRWFQRIP